MLEPPEESARPDRADALLLGLLALGVLVYWAFYYQPFVLPNNDWYSFERAAQSLSDGELPKSLKRMPLYPALIASLAPAIPAAASCACVGPSDLGVTMGPCPGRIRSRTMHEHRACREDVS